MIRILMIATLTLSRLTVLVGYHIVPTGGANRRTCTQSTPISAMWHMTHSLSYHMVLEWRPALGWVRCYWLEAIKIHSHEPLQKSRCKAVGLSPERDIGLQSPNTGYCWNWKWLEIEEWGGGMQITQNGQGPRLVGDMAVQPNSTCYTDGISRWKHPNASRRIHFRTWRDRQSILVKLSAWWCGSIWIVGQITFATCFVCKGPPWTTYPNIECPLQIENWPSSSWKQSG